ncbi:MAG TPA: hypothetical protein VMG32_11155 [Anaeromyxobacteraceae bacterium]|nr:hypothetical protein [Anaeromyxobacteraceae bacterium]
MVLLATALEGHAPALEAGRSVVDAAGRQVKVPALLRRAFAAEATVALIYIHR